MIVKETFCYERAAESIVVVAVVAMVAVVFGRELRKYLAFAK